MPGRVLQNHYCVAALQHQISYNDIMSLSANDITNFSASEHSEQPVASTRRAASPRRARARFCRAGLIIVTVLGTGVLAAACGGASASQTVSGHLNSAIGLDHALAWVNCMRTHGEPDMPNPTSEGNAVHISIKVGSGVDPRSPQYAAAFKACKHLMVLGKSGASGGKTITPADQADYLKAVACMRSHGFPKFPEPVFQDNSVSFNSTTPIDTNSAQYQRALATCDKLIPAGLPDSGRSPSA
jgi:hypothetical protein